MKRSIILAVYLLMTLILLCSCNSSEVDIPEGLQIVDENKAEGYIFFGPENWVIANRGGISASYVTAINTTSVSFAKTDATGDVDLIKYFDESMTALPYEITPLKHGESCTFGNCPDAVKFIYTYKYQEYDFATMQVLMKRDGEVYVFTYNSYGDPNDEASDYRRYLESVQLAIDSFVFNAKGSPESAPSYERDPDGYILVSDESISGFELYLPDTYTVVDNAAIVTAKISDSANITLAKASQTNVSILTYLQTRREELSAVTSNIRDIRISVPTEVDTEGKFFDDWTMDVLPTLDEEIVFGDLPKTNAVTYEYTYEYGTTTYHVYQVLGVDSYNGYVFTYTATEEEYAQHLDEIMTILRKVKF